MAQILYKDIIKNKEINEFIKKGDANLATLGYTEHSKTHCTLVAERAAYLLEKFRTCRRGDRTYEDRRIYA